MSDSFEATATEFKASGKVEFNTGMEIHGIDLGRLEFGRTNVSLGVLRTPDGGWDVSGGGQVYDLRPAVSGIFGSRTEGGAPVRLSARVERVILDDGQELRGVITNFYHTGEYWGEAAVDGTFQDGSPFRLRVEPKGAIRTLTILTDNAGSVSRGLQVFPGTVGGTMLVTAVMDDQSPGRPTIGSIVARDFRLVRAPVMAKLLAGIGSLTGLADLLAGEGIAFDKLEGSYSLENGVLKLEKTQAAGPALGLTVEGQLNLATQAAGFGGELVPAYSINTAVSKVPLLGQILAGGKGRGVFAFTYKMEGPMDDLKVTVNPLAALTPGFLRRIMSVLDGSSTPKASPAPEPPALADTDLDEELDAPPTDEWLPQQEEIIGLPDGSEPQDAPEPEFVPEPEIAARPQANSNPAPAPDNSGS